MWLRNTPAEQFQFRPISNTSLLYVSEPPPPCAEKQGVDCASFGYQACLDFPEWAKETCPKHCGFCCDCKFFLAVLLFRPKSNSGYIQASCLDYKNNHGNNSLKSHFHFH